MLEVLEEWLELEAINDVKLWERIYRQVMEADQWHVGLDGEEDQKNPTCTVLLEAKKKDKIGT